MLIGIVGKPSCGKSTILNALTMVDAKMGDYPFTTIKANKGVAYIRTPCPCADLEGSCNPRTGSCHNGTRYVPVEILDVAGLVPGASSGKGMGNQFLDDLRRANALIHVIDTSGTTDPEGNPVEFHNPADDVTWLNKELDLWIHKIIFDNWVRLARKIDADRTILPSVLRDQLSGLGATDTMVKNVLRDTGLTSVNPKEWSDEQKLELVKELRMKMFPQVIAANKIDRPKSLENLELIKKAHPEQKVISISGLAELTLRNADKKGLIRYLPGASDFEVLTDDSNSKFMKVVMSIKEKLLDTSGSTGVNTLLETVVSELLNMIVAYPVDDPSHLTDADGRILPDAFLVPKGTTAKEFAGKIHSDLGEKFINGILVNQSNKRVAATYELENGDILKINAAV